MKHFSHQGHLIANKLKLVCKAVGTYSNSHYITHPPLTRLRRDSNVIRSSALKSLLKIKARLKCTMYYILLKYNLILKHNLTTCSLISKLKKIYTSQQK